MQIAAIEQRLEEIRFSCKRLVILRSASAWRPSWASTLA
jgi:hypothetical protein